MNEVSVYRGGEKSLVKRTSLRPFLVVSVSSTEVSIAREAKDKLLLVQTEERMHKMCSSERDPPPLSTYVQTDVIHVI